MISKIYSASVIGIEAVILTIEVDIQPGMPQVNIVGLPDVAVKESKERVRSAIINSGYKFPMKKITINLAPANIKKEGSLFDLPIAIGILMASEQLPLDLDFGDFLFVGELSLNGSVRSVKGTLPITTTALSEGFSSVIVPSDNAGESAVVDGIDTYPVTSLNTTIELLTDKEKEPYNVDWNEVQRNNGKNSFLDFKDVKGQYNVKRGVEVATAGNHNLLLIGPPGCGKTMIAKRIPTILPNMTLNEAIETTKVYSVAGLVKPDEVVKLVRPFRAPHHTASDAAIVGGGSNPKPGEISLAHHGVLFLDEFVHFKKHVLQVLREPLEEKRVTISRSERSITYPANFMLVAAMNPCECGYFNHPDKECICSTSSIRRYVQKISGPILDRIDIQLEVSKISFDEIMSKNVVEEDSYTKRKKIQRAREIQNSRFENMNIQTNSQMNRRLLDEYCVLDKPTANLLKITVDRMGISARAYDKILKVSRTIADLDNRQNLEETDVLEAIQYRNLDRFYKL